MYKALTRIGLLGAVSAPLGFVYYNTADAGTQFQLTSMMGPVVRKLMDAETSHLFGIWSAKTGLMPTETRPDSPLLKTKVWGKSFPNPIGLAAGFDKDAEAIEGLMGVGFGFVEVGSVTPKPQPGNPKPRVFRIEEQKAIINRYGFNSSGVEAVLLNITDFQKKVALEPKIKSGVLGINFGKNKSSKDAAQDYSILMSQLGVYADYIVINVSSPNTPGLRALQGRRELQELVVQVKGTRDRMVWGREGPPPLLVKISPDLTELDKQDIAEVVRVTGVDGLVISNTTISRPGKIGETAEAHEAGGLSGPPLFELATRTLSDMYRLTGGKVPMIGVGGVSSGEDAYKKIRAGASLVQLYTAFAYDGPIAVPNMKQELVACLKRDGFANVAEAVGADHRMPGALPLASFTAAVPAAAAAAAAPAAAVKRGKLW